LATSWKPSADGLAWRVNLRDDVTFHDGSKFTAAAAREALLTALKRPGTAALYPGLTGVTDIQAPSDSELLILLKRRSGLLLDDLDFPITKRVDSKFVAGTGPFKEIRANSEEVVLEPHRGYYQGSPKIGRVIIRPYQTLRTAWASMMREEIDVLWDVAHDSTQFVDAGHMAFHTYLRRFVYVIAFNSARPQLSAAPVRRALNAAVDRSALIGDVLDGHGLAANGPIWPYHWAYDKSLPGYTHDPSLASATLDAAGLKETTASPGRVPSRLRFTCLVPEKWAVLERLALAVQKQLYDIGVDMQIQAVSAEEYLKRIPKGDFDAVIIDMISGPVLTRPYSFWRWGGEPTGYNVFGYRNTASDRWFDALNDASSDAQYRAAVAQLQRALLDDPPGLFLAWNERTRVINRRFTVPTEPGRDPMPQLWQWVPNPTAPGTTH
jgi:peptide/nickel transport system substrate-binding protein